MLLISLLLASTTPAEHMRVYETCVMEQAERISVLEETAEAVARAAQTACHEEWQELRRAAREGVDPRLLQDLDDTLDEFDRSVRSRASLAVMEARL